MRLRGKPDATSDIDRDKLAIQELVRLNRLSELEAKLASNPQLASKEVDGITPLHIACEVGSAAAIELLLEKRVSMNVKNPTKQTPLDICYHHNHQKTAILLLERGAQFTPGDVKTSVYSRYHRDVLDTTKNCGRTLLHWAARQGIHGECLTRLQFIALHCKSDSILYMFVAILCNIILLCLYEQEIRMH